MSDFKTFYKKGITLKYFPDDKVILLAPGKARKDDVLRLKSQLDTLLQIDGTKRVGDIFNMKLKDDFNVNIEELLKSLSMKGGIEQEDAQSMIDDSSEEDVKAQEKEQAPPPPEAGGMPALEGLSIASFLLFEEDLFQPGSKGRNKSTNSFSPGLKDKGRRASKRYGDYWKVIEREIGKNRNAVKTEDVLMLRKKFSLKPKSKDRDAMLKALDKASSYFYGRLEKVKGISIAEKFHEDYISIDNLTPDDYEVDDTGVDNVDLDVTLPNVDLNFDDIDYSDLQIEKD